MSNQDKSAVLAAEGAVSDALTMAITRLKRSGSTQEERFAAADGLRALLQSHPSPSVSDGKEEQS